jgi:predicted MFS family arabinose efflux permease
MPHTGLKAGRRYLGLVLAIVVGSGISHLGTSTMPFQIGALMDGRGLTASAAGLFGFFEIGALAATMILLSPVINRHSPAAVALTGAAATITTHLAMYAFAPSYAVLLILGAVAGIGYGMVFAGVIAGGSTAPSPDRLYAIGNGGGVLFVVGMMLLIPIGASRFGVMGPFLAIAVGLAVAAPAMLPLRSGARLAPTPSAGLARQPAVICLLILWAAYSLGAGAVWSFAERIGKTLAIQPDLIAEILSASTAAGVLGTGLTALISGRIPRVPALVLGLIGTGISCVALGFATNALTYTIGVMAYWIFYMYQYTLFLGTAAVLDPQGRVGTLGGGCERFAFAVSAPVGGLIADHGSYSLIGLFGLVCSIATIPFCLPAVARRLRGAPTPPIDGAAIADAPL